MTLDARLAKRFYEALEAAGMPAPPHEFSVVPAHQTVPASVRDDIARFIRAFDAVTTREAWREAALADAPTIARSPRRETCFFSAWDFHCPPEGGTWMIEFNDNGSGFLFAAIINALYREAAGLAQAATIVPPPTVAEFARRLGEMVEREAAAFFGAAPDGLYVVLDEARSLSEGKFRREFSLLSDLLRARGLAAEIAAPEATHWNGRRLLLDGRPVAFVVNRSTDFFLRGEAFAAVREAYQSGSVYVAPNPFSYATRSDKRLLAWLSRPDRDREFGVAPDERDILSAHVPETRLVDGDDVETLAERKREYVFKPLHGFAGRGVLDAAAVGRERLRRLAKQEEGYVAQRWIAKPAIEVGGERLWTDLRVWAYRGEIFNLSGRASRRPDRLDLTPPGGWLPTYAATADVP